VGETNQTMVEARGPARTFRTRAGAVEAVAGVDFAIGVREIGGSLGPNGAGKTTTQRMLSTLLAPTARAAVRGDFGSGSVAVGFIATLLLAVAGVAAGTRTFHRESA